MNLETLRQLTLPPVEHAYTTRETILYALGLGYGRNPLDARQLQYLYEEGLKVLPSMVAVLAEPGFWWRRPELGVDWVKVLHGEQSFRIHRPVPPAGRVRSQFRINAIEDKGKDRGAVVHQEKKLFDVESGELIATAHKTSFLRGDGGQGGFGSAPPPPEALPPRAPDQVLDIPTLPQMALIYRLSGDYNPIHADPAAARAAGFDRPILHGLCSMGMACGALIELFCDNEPARLQGLSVRFSRPVYPGETLRMECFEAADHVKFRVTVPEREVVVLDRGRADFARGSRH